MPIDYSKYPPNWKTEIVPAVLKRAGNCCESCGLANKQKVYAITLKVSDGFRYKQRSIWFRSKDDAEREKVFGDIREVIVVLTIAHLDHDELNHKVELDRLKALCQICHLRYDAKEKYQRSLIKWETKTENMTKEMKDKLRAAGREDLIVTNDILESGYAGVNKEGRIVDRRIDPTAVHMPYNSMFPNTPPPKKV